MIINDIKIAFRNIKSNFFYSAINIIGLSIGIAASVMISFYVLDELSFDRFHVDAENTYRVGLRAKVSGQEVAAAATCPPMAATVQAEFPEIKEVIRLAQWREVPVKFEEKAFTEQSVILADSNFFSFFSFKLLYGEPSSVLAKPQSLVLSESIAAKYFTDEDPSSIIGKIIEVGNDKIACSITGIVEDAPANSHFSYDMILSMDTWEASKSNMWVNNFLYNYVKLYPEANPAEVEEKFAGLVEKYVGPEAAQVLGMDVANASEDEFYYGYFLMPIRDIHLHSKLVAELKPASDIKYVYTFSAIALFILLIAIINFVNLTTAKAGKRAKEVGIRKTAGALRGKLIAQFLMESTLQALIAMLIAGAIIKLTINVFNQLAQKELFFDPLSNFWIAPSIIILTLFIGLIAGIYPAIYLTAFRPAEVLRGTWGSSMAGRRIRSVLVIIQFAISTFLIVSTILVYKQMNLLRTQDIGFDKEQVMVIKNGTSLGTGFLSFKDQLVSLPEISSLSKSTHLPPGIDNSSLFRPDEGGEDHLVNYYWADYDQLRTLNLEMAAGRYYSRDYPSDSNAIIINEVAMSRFGWDSYEGHRLLTFLSNTEGGSYVDVIGIVKDFNFRTLKEEIQPMVIILGDFGNLISIKLSTSNYADVITKIESEWKKIANGAPFDYYFLDEEFNNAYQAEQRMGNVFMVFTILAIIIACLGLFGLATFTAEQKTKEIGIRKALGASLSNIVLTLSGNFMKLVAISIIISMPFAYYAMNLWLQQFAYKTSFDLFVFIGTAVLVLIIALGTVSFQAINVALSKPADALKAE